MSSRNHQIMSGRLHIWSGCLSLARRPVFISFLMCHRVWQSHHKKTKWFCKTKKCQKIWQIIFSVYNYIVKLKKDTFIPYEKTHGNKNQNLWSITQQKKITSGWLFTRTRRFQKNGNFEKTKKNNGKNVESSIRNFKTFTWWIKKSWLKTQSKQKSSNRSKKEKFLKTWSDDVINGSFVHWFSACVLCEKFKHWILFTQNEYLSVE